MLTVIITLNDGTQDVKDCWDISDLCLDGVSEILVIRDDSKKAS